MATSLTERDKKVVWHPYTPQKSMPVQIPVVKGEGTYIIDAEGNTYIDAISSWWVTIHGHGNTYIAEKIFEQAKTLEQVIFAGFTHEPHVEDYPVMPVERTGFSLRPTGFFDQNPALDVP